jgi:YbbR domain-containing protein
MSKFGSTTKKVLLNNWALKVLALILAFITYQSIKDAISFEVPFEIPVEVDVEKGIAILDQNPRTVEVTFQGSRADLKQLTHGQMKVVLTPKATNPSGSELITITPGNVEGAAGVRVVKIRPKDVQLTFDRESEKKVAIAKPKVRGAPLIGKVEIDYQPKTATIRGPKRRLDEKSILDTEPIDVDGRVQSFTKLVKILPPADSMVTEIEPSEVEVTVSIVTDTVSRDWTNVTVTAMTRPGLGYTITVDPATVNIQLHGRKDLVAGIKDSDLTAFVDCMSLTPGSTKQLPVNVYFPIGPELTATVLPETVKVTASHPPKPQQEAKETETP